MGHNVCQTHSETKFETDTGCDVTIKSQVPFPIVFFLEGESFLEALGKWKLGVAGASWQELRGVLDKVRMT